MDINKLTALDTFTGSDLLPVWSQANGDTRKLSGTALAAFIATQVASGKVITQYAAPAATGFTVAIAPLVTGADVYLRLTPVGAYAAGTLTLPAVASCVDGQQLIVFTTQAVTALTIAGNGATAVLGAPTTLAQFARFRLRFDAVSKTWDCIG
jgi:hypothetical protein